MEFLQSDSPYFFKSHFQIHTTQLNNTEKATKIIEIFLSLYVFIIVFLFVVSTLLMIFILYSKTPSSSDLFNGYQYFGKNRFALLIIYSILFTLRIAVVCPEISTLGKYIYLIPHCISTTFTLLINTIHIFLIALLSQVYIFFVVSTLSPLNRYEIGFIIQVSVLTFLITVILLIKSLKIKSSLQGQSTHMSAIHHEIKTPLQGIVGSSDIILNEVSSNNYSTSVKESVNHFVEIIKISSVYLIEVIENMMKYSDVLNDTCQLKLSKIKLGDFLQELKVIVSAYPRNSSVQIVFEFSNNLPEFIYAERTSLQQIIINLLSNSIKFTESGFIKLSSFKVDQSIYFVCEDSGPGMSPEFVSQKLFQPFSQEKRSSTRLRGLGLGLSLSKHLIQQMGGRLEAESVQGRGTKMTISLPIKPSNLKIVTEESSSQSRVAKFLLPLQIGNPTFLNQIVPDLKFQKIALVIDDNGLNRRVLSSLLKINKFHCIEASGGREALYILSQNINHIHVILLDMFMPSMDGFEAAIQIKELTKTWEFPPLIIGCSADNSTETQKKFLEAGISHFLNKPITSAAISSIHKLLQQHFQYQGKKVSSGREIEP